MASSDEQYELFLALAKPRLGVAEAALALADGQERSVRLNDALVPFVVDAALLGADGLRELALAILDSKGVTRSELEQALAELERATEELGQGDASGARVDESRLRGLARTLMTGQGHSAARPQTAAVPSASSDNPAKEEDPDSHWTPNLAEDMLAAFLDECGERTDSLSERLLRLEQNADDRELINDIFRDLHTLKGSSAFAGLTKMNRVAHKAEDLIGALREGRRRVDRSTIDVLLEALDVLRSIVERARTGQRIEVDVRGLLSRLADPPQSNANSGTAAALTAPSVDSKADELPARAEVSQRTEGAAQSTLRIEFEKVDHLLNLVGEVVLARGRLTGASEVQATILREVGSVRKRLGLVPQLSGAGEELNDELERLERVLRETFGEVDLGLGGLGLAVGQLRDTVMKLRMVPIARLFSKYQRTVRELANNLDKQITVELSGAETELDKVLVERLEDPLLHLVRNAVDHGIESPDERESAGKPRAGRVRLSANRRGGQILVAISDDGRGLDPEKLKRKAIEKGLLTPEEAQGLANDDAYQLIFRAGFSTAETVSDVSGRGVGMDVVRDALKRLKGDVRIVSEVGKGTTLELSLPLTLAIAHVLTARTGGELVAIPLDAVVSAQTVVKSDLERVATGLCIRVGDALIPVVDLSEVLGLSGGTSLGENLAASVVIVRVGVSELALLVQQVLGRHEVVIKALGPLLSSAPCTAGAALIGERMVLVVDLADVAARAISGKGSSGKARSLAVSDTRARVLVAEDSPMIRDSIRRELTRAGFEVTVAEDGEQALALARAGHFDAVSSDVMMPKMDGYDLVRALRQEPRYRRIPIVMVTSKDARIDAVKGFDAGADAYLAKPAEADELVRTLDALLRKNR